MRKGLLCTLLLAVTITGWAQTEAVDLGLSVKWASCNLGASAPTEFGDYFAWGETAPKERYNWESLAYCTDAEGNQFTKYVTGASYGPVDGKGVLGPEDDPAQAVLGEGWRLPTKEECFELWRECQWKWKKVDGVKGFLVTSKKNGNSIFLPAAGYYFGRTNMGEGYGSYWSSSLAEGAPFNAYCLSFAPHQAAGTSLCERRYGLPVRPVTE